MCLLVKPIVVLWYGGLFFANQKALIKLYLFTNLWSDKYSILKLVTSKMGIFQSSSKNNQVIAAYLPMSHPYTNKNTEGHPCKYLLLSQVSIPTGVYTGLNSPEVGDDESTWNEDFCPLSQNTLEH